MRSSADASMFTVEELVNALDGEGVKYVEVPVLRVPKDVMLDVDSDPSVWKMVADGYREYVGSSIMAREAVAQMRGMAQSVYPQKLVVLMSGEVSYSYQFMVLRDRLCAEARVFRLKTNSLCISNNSCLWCRLRVSRLDSNTYDRYYCCRWFNRTLQKEGIKTMAQQTELKVVLSDGTECTHCRR